MQSNYSVVIEKFAERHFIKNFKKKYGSHWDTTLRAIIAELERIDMLINTNRADSIIEHDKIKIIKTEFRVAQTKYSARASGNRCIVVWNEDKRLVSVLLVYNQTDLSGHNETEEWKKIIRDNYEEYRKLL